MFMKKLVPTSIKAIMYNNNNITIELNSTFVLNVELFFHQEWVMAQIKRID